jgi:hypothetical protein
MPDGDLRHLAEVEEISIGFARPDGSAGSTPVWVAQAAGTGGCVPTLTARSATGPTPTPCARPVEDAGIVEVVTRAYEAKYGDSPYVGPLLTEEAADATLRLEPRP